MKLTIRSIGIKRAEATVIMANIAYNMGRWRSWEGRFRLMQETQTCRQIGPNPAAWKRDPLPNPRDRRQTVSV
jgi:hypothetical protein